MSTRVSREEGGWPLVARGGVAVLFGIAALVWPGETQAILRWLFAIFALLAGGFAILAALQEPSPSDGEIGAHGYGSRITAAVREHAPSAPRWVLMIEGLVGIAAGLLVIFWPSVTSLILLYLIAVWALITGLLDVVAAFRLNNWLIGAAGATALVFGIALISFSSLAVLSLIWLTGLFAVVYGILTLLRGLQMEWQQPPAAS